jgi:ElaA protein
VLHWQFARFDDLAPRDWYAVSATRIEVFVIEQNCPFQDLDGADFHSWHLVGWHEAEGKRELAAYCRLVDAGVKFPQPSIGRVVTAPKYRLGGFGKALLVEACARHDSLYPGLPNRIGAQARLEKFYQAFGYVTDSAEYIEDGIPHLEMQRPAHMSRTK